MAVMNVCSLTFAAPVLVADKSLPGIDITSIGVITSIFPICYGFSKFISGVVSTKVSAQLMLGGTVTESFSFPSLSLSRARACARKHTHSDFSNPSVRLGTLLARELILA